MIKNEPSSFVVIPPVPLGILRPWNLYNDTNDDLPPLSWFDKDLHSRLGWIGEEIPELHDLPGGLNITKWWAPMNSSPLGTSYMQTMFHVDLGPGLAGFDGDCRNLMIHPGLIVYQARMSRPDPTFNPNAPLRQYPGFDIVHPAAPSPIGDAWPDHPWILSPVSPKMFHSAAGDKFAVDALCTFKDGSSYRKVRFMVLPGSGPVDFAWMKVN